MRLQGKQRKSGLGDRLTVGLALTAAATAGVVVGGELLKLTRRRAREAAADPEVPAPTGVLETAEHAIVNTQLATQDAVQVAFEGYAATPRHETILFNLLAGFIGAFAFARLSTYGMRAGWWPFENVKVGGRHIHHFVPGILLAFGAGATALFTEDEALEQTLAVPFGVGLGLTLDEAALLLDLRDVYWTPEGILSVQVSLGASALMGGTVLALRILRRGEEQAEEQGAIPAWQ
ncbi:MAG: hypothetical protein M3383_03675 [Actinomycetota bacterium]|nr:hypothetical protein [Actinomycetota bacterium]